MVPFFTHFSHPFDTIFTHIALVVSPATSRLTVDSDIDMKDTSRIQYLTIPTDADEPATKSYTDDNFLKTDGTKK